MGINQFVGRFPKVSPGGVTLPRFGFSSGTVRSLSLQKDPGVHLRRQEGRGGLSTQEVVDVLAGTRLRRARTPTLPGSSLFCWFCFF